MGRKESKSRAFLAVYAHGHTLNLCTARLLTLSTSLRIFPIQLAHVYALRHLQLLLDLLHQDFEFHYPTRSMTFIHLLPDATFAPPSQAMAYPPHLLAFTVPALFFSQLFF